MVQSCGSLGPASVVDDAFKEPGVPGPRILDDHGPTLSVVRTVERTVERSIRRAERFRSSLQALYNQRILDCHYAFPHATGRKAGEPVQDVKNAFHTALETAEINDFTWHDLRHTFASWLIMKGASLRSVAELLGHRGLRMVMRYAHLSPEHLSAEVGLLDRGRLHPPRRSRARVKRAKKGQRAPKGDQRPAKVVEFPKEIGSSGWIRTSNPPVNSNHGARAPSLNTETCATAAGCDRSDDQVRQLRPTLRTGAFLPV